MYGRATFMIDMSSPWSTGPSITATATSHLCACADCSCASSATSRRSTLLVLLDKLVLCLGNREYRRLARARRGRLDVSGARSAIGGGFRSGTNGWREVAAL